MKMRSLLFCFSYYWVKRKNRTRRRNHRHSIADASQNSSGIPAMDHPNHRRHHHIEYTSPVFTRARVWEHRRCVADVSAIFLTLIDIFFRCLGWAWRLFASVALSLSFAELLAHGGADQAMSNCVHRESSGRLKKPRGTMTSHNSALYLPFGFARQHCPILISSTRPYPVALNTRLFSPSCSCSSG